ncbi:chaplin [Streptomyces sp. NPDC090023]|uniref:chaplin n=1 Tax=unclassified Streptomyces TaxID=2593676 RepID=UPI003811661D
MGSPSVVPRRITGTWPIGSPGVLSGNVLQIPVHVPINLCGNTVNVIGALNPAFGNTCANL